MYGRVPWLRIMLQEMSAGGYFDGSGSAGDTFGRMHRLRHLCGGLSHGRHTAAGSKIKNKITSLKWDQPFSCFICISETWDTADFFVLQKRLQKNTENT